MATLKIKSRFNNHQPREYGFKPVGESMTQQQFEKETNVNNIMAKYKKTGLLTHYKHHQGNFGDFSTIEDYQTSLNKIMQAQDSFESLPSEVRSKFFNDPGKLIDFLSKPENDEEAIALGLKIKVEGEPSIQQSFEAALENNDIKRSKKTGPKE